MPPLSEALLRQLWDMLLYAQLPALGMAAAVMAAVVLLCGTKQAPLAAALGLTAGAALGLCLRDAVRLTGSDIPWSELPSALLGLCLREAPALVSGDSSWNYLPWTALAALWVGRMLRLLDVQPIVDWSLRAALALVIAWVVIPLNTRRELDWLAPAFAALVLALWALLERLATELPDGSVPFCLALVFCNVGMVLIYAHSNRLMEVALVLGCALAGIAAVAWWRQADTSGAMPAAAVMLPGLLLVGQQSTFNEMPWYTFALPAVAPLLLAEVLALKEWQTTRLRLARWLLMVALILIPLAVACYLADQAEGPLEIPER